MRRFFPALESRDYRRLFYAAGLSAISLWALITARGWIAYELTGTATATALVTFAAIGPWVLAPIGGALADRYDRARVVMICRLGACATAVALAVLAFTGSLALWNLVLVTFISGVIRSGEMPAQAALLPNTVKAAALLSAITLASMMQFGSKVIGPIAGPVLSEFGAGPTFLAAAGILLLSVWQMTRIETRSTGGARAVEGSIFSTTADNVREGLSYLGRAPAVRLTIGLVALHCMLTMAFDLSLLPVFASRVLAGPPEPTAGALNFALGLAGAPLSSGVRGAAEFGYMLQAFGGGALVATIALSMVPGGAIRGRLLLIVGCTSGACLILVGLSNSLLIAVIGGVLTGASTAMFMALSSVMIQAVVPDEIRGRVMSLYAMFAGGVMSISALVSGLAADLIDVRYFAVVPGILFLIVMLICLLGVSPLRGIMRHGEIREQVPPAALPAPAAGGD